MKGQEKHPLYQAIIEAQPKAPFKPESKLLGRLTESGAAPATQEVSWNFEKFVVDRKGAVAARFGSDTEPQDEVVVGSVRKLLVS